MHEFIGFRVPAEEGFSILYMRSPSADTAVAMIQKLSQLRSHSADSSA